jgi:phospholipid/cholesterol/gamma-HCH transport system permease protein
MKNVLDDLAASFGSATLNSVGLLGTIGLFLWKMLKSSGTLLRKRHLLTEQMMAIGVASFPIVWISATFTGFIVTWQVQYLAGGYIPLRYLGFAVGKVVFTDLGPVLTALVLTGRISAKLTSELGLMKITDQMDAMTCLSLDPYSYLLAPRLLASFLMTPVLFVFSFFFAIISAQTLATLALGLPAESFYISMRLLFRVRDVVIGMVKGFVFGGLMSLAGCYFGYYASGGATGVGRSTMKSVVAASVLILLFNLIINNILM